MKLGTKNKWAEWLASGRYTADRLNCGLRVTYSDGTQEHSILGVLADFLNPNGWAAADGTSIQLAHPIQMLSCPMLPSTAVRPSWMSPR